MDHLYEDVYHFVFKTLKSFSPKLSKVKTPSPSQSPQQIFNNYHHFPIYSPRKNVNLQVFSAHNGITLYILLCNLFSPWRLKLVSFPGLPLCLNMSASSCREHWSPTGISVYFCPVYSAQQSYLFMLWCKVLWLSGITQRFNNWAAQAYQSSFPQSPDHSHTLFPTWDLISFCKIPKYPVGILLNISWNI